MSHLIIDRKTREFIKEMAVASLGMEDIHDAYEGMTAGAAKDAAAVKIDTLSDFLSDEKSNFLGKFEDVKTAVGL